jgi:L-alanine-DL-glutamate epimerase-like enolase superfamily enzyme
MIDMKHDHLTIDGLEVSVYTVPLEQPESDGTLTWDRTTVVAVEPAAGGITGLGFTYGTGACATLIRDVLEAVVVGREAMDVGGSWEAMARATRNFGRPGIVSMAIAAVDTALWDLKARLLEVPLARLLGMRREAVPVYGSGGFTSLSEEELTEQLQGWVHGDGIPRVKIKVGEAWGTNPERDLERTHLARKVIGDAELYVDANGGYNRKQGIRMARGYSDLGVTWFEEPVSSDDLEGLRVVREAIDIDVAAGEYGYDLVYFERMCASGAVDCLQADVSRCAGITDWLRAAAVAAAHGLEISGHTAESLHAHPACAVQNLRHLEYFADHARVDRLLFDGVLKPEGGVLRPDFSRHGMGLELKRTDAERYREA